MRKKRDAVCAHCGQPYTERRGSSYRHFSESGKVTWCHSKSMERRLKVQGEPPREGKAAQ